MGTIAIIEFLCLLSVTGAAFAVGFAVGVIIERKKVAAEYEWHAGVHDRLNKVEELINEEYHYVENQLEKFRHELSYTQKFVTDELNVAGVTLELPDASDEY